MQLPSANSNTEVHLVKQISYPFQEYARDVARLLLMKAMLHLQKGNNEKAFESLLKIHKFAEMQTHKCSLIEQYTWNSTRYLAHEGELQIALHGQLSKKQSLEFYNKLASLKGPSGIVETINVHERVAFLDVFQQLEQGRDLDGFLDLVWDRNAREIDYEVLRKFVFDRNLAVRKMNLLFDRMVSISSKSFLDSRNEMKVFKQEEIQTRAKYWGMQNLRDNEMAAFSKMIFLRDFYFSDLYFHQIRRQFDVNQYDRSIQDRAKVYFEMSKIVFLLVAYKAEHKKYPIGLEQLVPTYLKAVPIDLFSGKPFIYKSNRKNFIIYSIGEDQIDDSGIPFSTRAKTHDYVFSSSSF